MAHVPQGLNKILAQPCTHLMSEYRKFNRLYFNNQLPKNVSVFWNDWCYEHDTGAKRIKGNHRVLGLSTSIGATRLGPFYSRKQADTITKILNTDKKKQWDWIRITSHGAFRLVPVPYIMLAGRLNYMTTQRNMTLLHEMIHIKMDMLGHGYPHHGRYFRREFRRVITLPGVLDMLI